LFTEYKYVALATITGQRKGGKVGGGGGEGWRRRQYFIFLKGLSGISFITLQF